MSSFTDEYLDITSQCTSKHIYTNDRDSQTRLNSFYFIVY